MNRNDIELGFGYITGVDGVPGPADQINYGCTYVIGEGVYTDIEGQAPYIDRWDPDRVDVYPNSINTPFVVMRLDGQFIPGIPRELPVLGTCGTPGMRGPPGGGMLAAFLALPTEDKIALARELKRFL